MYIEQLYTGCLAEAAYYIESEGEAVVIDPLRETLPYLSLAKSRGAKIKYVFETHFHADFVSGHIDLAREAGAIIVYGPNARPGYSAQIAKDGEFFSIGNIYFEVLHTPGHTLESSCFLLFDENKKAHALFSGDTLFVGEVGRPDLAVQSNPPLSQDQLAGMLYDSLREKIMPLADDILLYPAHGPGSSCGKNIGPETWSTLGHQKAGNYALQPMSREAFIKALTEGLTSPPPYFFEDARINMTGYGNIDQIMAENLKALSPEQFQSKMDKGTLILDTRIPDEFETGFISGAINIGLNGTFAVWVGTLLNINQPLLIVASPGKEEESILRLARVGYENVKGFLDGGVENWKKSEKPLDTVRSISPEEFTEKVKIGQGVVLDVRRCTETANSHVKGALNIPLNKLEANLDKLEPAKTYLIHCQGGYRSMIAASILKANGIHNIVNIYKGFSKICQLEIGLVAGKPTLQFA